LFSLPASGYQKALKCNIPCNGQKRASSFSSLQARSFSSLQARSFHHYTLIPFVIAGPFLSSLHTYSFRHCGLVPFIITRLFLSSLQARSFHHYTLIPFVIAGLTRNPLLTLVMEFPCQARTDYIPIAIGDHPTIRILCTFN